MNRYDQIKDMAHRIANVTCPATGDQEQTANDLIKLVTLVVAAVGKGVAVDGESTMNDPFNEDEAAHARYITGERIQTAAQEVHDASVGADLGRYAEPVSIVQWAKAQAVARGPFAPGELTRLAHETADAMREQHKTPLPDEQPVCGWLPGDATTYCDFDRNCPTHGDAAPTVTRPKAEHVWLHDTEGPDIYAPDEVRCRDCRVSHCGGGCGDPDVGAAPDVDCPVHGDRLARWCRGARLTPRTVCECPHPPEDHKGGECVDGCDCPWMPGNGS